MFATIRNDSVTAELLSYAFIYTKESKGNELVWAEFPPSYPKQIAAIWASLVTNSAKSLTLADGDKGKSWNIQPLKRAYRRFVVDCPNLGQTRQGQPKFARLVHPNVGKTDTGQGFFILDRFGHSPAELLAATLEHHTSCPMMVGWGEYMLAAAQALGTTFCNKLTTGSQFPVEGYWFAGDIPWKDIVATGVEKGYLTLEGNSFIPAEIPIKQEVVV
ncbi:MAG: hypothetical protein K8R77_01940 [Anaerolineaceae bacterium]|nr:hypothetical protein [Anaerolineaceae bacterium]